MTIYFELAGTVQLQYFGRTILTVHFWQSFMAVHFRDQLTRGYIWLRQMLPGSILASIQLFMQWWIRAFEKVKNFIKKKFQKFQKIILFKNQNILKCWSTWSKRERRIKVKNQCIVGSAYGSAQKPMYRIGIFCHVITFAYILTHILPYLGFICILNKPECDCWYDS